MQKPRVKKPVVAADPASKRSASSDPQAGRATVPDKVSLNETPSAENAIVSWRKVTQFCIVGLFFVAFIAALLFARPLLLPIVSAFVIGMMLGPLASWLRRQGIPQIVVGIALWLLVIGLFYAVIQLLATPLLDWVSKAPDIGRNIHEKLRVFESPLQTLTNLRNAILPQGDNTKMGFDVMVLAQPVLTVLTPAIGEIFVFFGVLFFFLIGRAELRHVIVAFSTHRETRLRTLKIINDIESSLTGYLSVVMVINFVVGVAGGTIAWAVGLPSPVAWGVLAFLLNFIPYIGALMMEFIFLAVGLVTFPTLTAALIAPVLYLGFTTLEGHFVTPAIMGRRLTLNPLTVFLALIFWSWLWGPIGAFLAVPLLIVALVAINHLFPKPEAVIPG